MRYQLSSQELTSYAQDGFLVRKSVFDKQELALLRKAVERAAMQAHQLRKTGRIYILDGKTFVDIGHTTVQYEPESSVDAIKVIEPVHELDPALGALVDNPKITAPMCSLLGSKSISLWTDKLNLKRPRDGSGFGWHQDSPYWVHDSKHVDELHNVYIALDDAGEENGCFRIIRGSHTRGCLPGTDDGTMLGGFYTDPRCFDRSREVTFDLPAGSLVFFHAHTVHGSQANHSDMPRRALIMTYQPAGFPMLKSGNLHTTTCPGT